MLFAVGCKVDMITCSCRIAWFIGLGFFFSSKYKFKFQREKRKWTEPYQYICFLAMILWHYDHNEACLGQCYCDILSFPKFLWNKWDPVNWYQCPACWQCLLLLTPRAWMLVCHHQMITRWCCLGRIYQIQLCGRWRLLCINFFFIPSLWYD